MNRFLFNLCVAVAMILAGTTVSSAVHAEALRILHVMSYHADWKWNKDQLEGFQSALQHLDVEYKIVELDTKRHDDPAHLNRRVAEANEIVNSWKPHLIYTNDDNAQRYFSMQHVNSDIPIVFSGVNRDPSEYDFLGSNNITGILEQEHFVATVKLLQRLKPGVRKIAVLVDKDPTWKGVMGRMRSNLRALPGVEITHWIMAHKYSEYQQHVRDLQGKVDALATLGVFNLEDSSGAYVDYQDVLRWTAENSQLPDFAFWQSRVERGTLCAVNVSGYEQGKQAGEIARMILEDHVKPSSIPIRASHQGQPAISLARSRALGIRIDSELMLNSSVVKQFVWDQ